MSDQGDKAAVVVPPQATPKESRDIIRTWLTILALIQTIFLAGVIGTGLLTIPAILNAYKDADKISQIATSMKDLRDSTQLLRHKVESLRQALETSTISLGINTSQFQKDMDRLRASAIAQKKQIDSLMRITDEYQPFMVKKSSK